MPTDQNQVSPRSTDRTRRRAAQAKHAEQAQVEAATLTPPRGEEKAKQIAANRAAEIARFGASGTTRRQTLQAENREAAKAQDAQFAGATVLQQAKLVPGQQVDHRTARMFAKAQDRADRDENRKAARAAGTAVLEVLDGRGDRGSKTSVHRKAARQAAKVAAAQKQETT